MAQHIAKVLVASRAQNLDRLFDYRVPRALADNLKIGARVIVPFQNQPCLAYVWELADHSEFPDLKEIQQLIDDPPLINSYSYELIKWMADYYFCSRVDVIKLCLPPGGQLTQKASYQLACDLAGLYDRLTMALFSENDAGRAVQLIASGLKAGWSKEKWRQEFREIQPVLDFLLKKKILQRVYLITQPKVSPKNYKLYYWNDPETGKDGETGNNRKTDDNRQTGDNRLTDKETPAGKRVRDVLIQSDGLPLADLVTAAKVSVSVIQRLVRQGKITCLVQNSERIPVGFQETAVAREIQFNEEQQSANEIIGNYTGGKPFLLHGVTGSGKTEVYFEIASRVLESGFQVLYLVPEIALTPQTLQRARSRFGEQVALLHSNMSDGERYDQWFKIKNSRANFVLGARSAIFAPFHRLGLIIIDEAHESTYKQEETPRYHAVTIAQKIAEITGAKLILGSATPAVESFFHARTGNFNYLQLKERYNRNPLPEVLIINMREELQKGNKNILSTELRESLTACLQQNKQAILLLNRRGYATFILCRDCGLSLKCPSCDVSLTYHVKEPGLRCHYCDYRQPVPDTCPNCGSTRIRYFGNGTQKLEEELAMNFQGARILRMDLDSTSHKGAHHQIYQQLHQGEIDILLGTQMIAKGLDLPKVTVVGVISADSTLNFPDFRASERTFSLLTQVAGRAGRGEAPGKVIFQTYHPEHYSLQFAQKHDYISFYEQEIEYRRVLNYPPFSELVKFNFTGIKEARVSAAAMEFSEILARVRTETRDTSASTPNDIPASGELPYFLDTMGPAPCLIPKIQDRYRWQTLIKSNHQALLEQIVKISWERFPFRDYQDVKISRDRNPYSTL
jgi:primosomal protein N' (replication factor Y)